MADVISVRIQGLDTLKASISGMGKQINYAASRALNAVGKKGAQAMPGVMNRVLDNPTPFTQRGVRVLKYASKTNLSVTVGFMAAQEKYMQYATDGGVRQPGPEGLKLPGAVKLNAFGNIPKGLIAQLISVAKKERKLSKVKARKVSISNKVDIFYGDPTDHNGKASPRGIYKRVEADGKSQLIPLVIFPVTPAKYKVRLDLKGEIEVVVRAEWEQAFDVAMAEALRTARP